MKIQWLGHACFLIRSQDGTSIITDPYERYETLHYNPVDESADIVTISHNHNDHNNAKDVKGTPEVIRESGSMKVKNIVVKSIPCYHDDAKGEKRGKNLINVFTIDNIRVCHLGDLGHMLSAKEKAEIGSVDVLLTPVGGLYTIDAETATKICSSLKPKIVIPMHFKTAKLDFPITDENAFLSDKSNVRKLNSSEVEITKETLPATMEIIVLKYAR